MVVQQMNLTYLLLAMGLGVFNTPKVRFFCAQNVIDFGPKYLVVMI